MIPLLSAPRTLPRSPGFTLIELMVTLAIAAIVLAIGLPQLREFIADQRVRAAVSDIYGDLTYARTYAIANQTSDGAVVRVVVAAVNGSNWNAGWRICIQPNSSSYACDGGATLLRTGPALGDGLKSCASLASLAGIAFLPDGRLDAAGFTSNQNIRISDDLQDADSANDKIRSIYFAPMGRFFVARENGGLNGATACP